MNNKFLFLAAPLITLLMLFAFSTCEGGSFYDPGHLAAPDFAKSGGGSGGGGSFSSLIGEWGKSSGQTLKEFIRGRLSLKTEP